MSQLAGVGRRRKRLAWGGNAPGQKGPTGRGQKGPCSPRSCKPPRVQGCCPRTRMPISKRREMGTSGSQGTVPFWGGACICVGGVAAQLLPNSAGPLTPVLHSPAFSARSGTAGLQQRGSEHRLCPACCSPGAELGDEALFQIPEQC